MASGKATAILHQQDLHVTEAQNYNFTVEPGKTLFACGLLNTGSFANIRFSVDGHALTVVESGRHGSCANVSAKCKLVTGHMLRRLSLIVVICLSCQVELFVCATIFSHNRDKSTARAHCELGFRAWALVLIVSFFLSSYRLCAR